MEKAPLYYRAMRVKRPVVDEQSLQVLFDFPEDVKQLDMQLDSEFAELVKVGINLESLYQEVIKKLTVTVN